MAISTMDTLALSLAQAERKGFHKGSFTPAAAGSYHSLWTIAGQPSAGVTPGSLTPGVLYTDASVGSFPFVNAAGAQDNYLSYVACTGLQVGTLVVYDRLWANSTTVATAGAQAVTFPGLTRSTDGVGVEAWIEWYVASGAGAVAANSTVTYTDESGNAGAAGTVVQPARTKAIGDMFPMDMASGDSGVRAISSMNIITSQTTGTWGVTLLKRLAEIPIRPSDQGASVLNAVDLALPSVPDDACLAFMFQGAAAANTLAGSLAIGKA